MDKTNLTLNKLENFSYQHSSYFNDSLGYTFNDYHSNDRNERLLCSKVQRVDKLALPFVNDLGNSNCVLVHCI